MPRERLRTWPLKLWLMGDADLLPIFLLCHASCLRYALSVNFAANNHLNHWLPNPSLMIILITVLHRQMLSFTSIGVKIISQHRYAVTHQKQRACASCSANHSFANRSRSMTAVTWIYISRFQFALPSCSSLKQSWEAKMWTFASQQNSLLN